MNYKLEKWLSIPKSLYVSIRLCGLLKGIKLPIIVRYNTVLRNLSGRVISPTRGGGGIIIGFGSGEGTADLRYVRSVLEISGTIIVHKKFHLGAGTRLCVSGTLEVGHVTNSSRLHLICMNHITMGDHVLFAWDTCIMDSDMHEIIEISTKRILPISSPIEIGNNVWIGTRSLILKGCRIPNGCIIGAKSVVTKKFDTENCIITGNPARIVKNGYTRLVNT